MLGRDAALKVLHPSYSARPEIVTRFFNEARAASMIADPGIVQIFDFGYHTDGSAFIVMELLDGEPLDSRLRRLGRFSPADALLILRQVATSLGAAHACGIVHRDLKPENMFLVRDPEVAGGERAKLLDFGIAKLSNDLEAGVKTQTSAMMGTPTYMSPEQCRGAGAVDQRSDVYALGCVLYTLIVGEPPFIADGVGEIIAMHLREPAPRAATKAPWIALDLDAVIARCLEKDPAIRYSSGAELATVFGDLLTRSTAAATGSGLQPQPLDRSHTTLSSATSSSGSAPPRTSRTLALSGAVIAIAAAVLFGATTHSREEPEPAPSIVIAATPNDSAAPPSPEAPSPTPPEPTPREQTEHQLVKAVEQFARWTVTHTSSACPTAAALGASTDVWGHAFVVTCSKQPALHRIGVISPGPDGKVDTNDDIATWMLDPTRLKGIVGPRWKPESRHSNAITRPNTSTQVSPPTPAAPQERKTPKPMTNDRDGDGIPDER